MSARDHSQCGVKMTDALTLSQREAELLGLERLSGAELRARVLKLEGGNSWMTDQWRGGRR